MRKADIKGLLGPVIAFPPVFARVAGSVTAGIMLSQLHYWTGRERDADGWIYKTQAEMERETTLSRREQEGARRRLRELGVLSERRRKVPARMRYRIDYDRLGALIGQTRMAQTAKVGDRKAANQNGANRQADVAKSAKLSISETTPEITSKNQRGKPVDKSTGKEPEGRRETTLERMKREQEEIRAADAALTPEQRRANVALLRDSVTGSGSG